MVSRTRSILAGAGIVAALGFLAAAQTKTAIQRFGEALNLRSQGSYAEAQAIFEELRQQSERGAPESITLGLVLDAEGQNQMALGHYLDAEGLLRRSVEFFRRGNDRGVLAAAKSHLAQLYMEERRPADAEPLLREATDTLAGRDLALTYDDLAIIRVWKRDYAGGEQLFRKSLNLLEAEFGPHDVLLNSSLCGLAFVLSAMNRHFEAVELVDRAKELVLAPESHAQAPDRVGVTNAVALIYSQAGRAREAVRYAREAIAMVESLYGDTHPKVATYLHADAAIFRNAGAKSEAKKMEARARAIWAQVVRNNPTQLTVSIHALR